MQKQHIARVAVPAVTFAVLALVDADRNFCAVDQLHCQDGAALQPVARIFCLGWLAIPGGPDAVSISG